ncbi:Rha family transcriptional regulator [Yokenella regensburgei]|uniref:Rha family transcriptional regulator n=1 Tax=Yokenella regensburgei TaxID=158877 RepID=UPI003ED8CFA1
MVDSISCVIPEITIHNGRAVTTSIAVANYFEKPHDNVLKKIRTVMLDCPPSYRLVNFNETSYTRENPNGGPGIETPMFELTRDAFVLIVMGFTGKKALQWKIRYIEAFNEMEEELRRRPLTTTSCDMIQGGPRTVVIRFGEAGNIEYISQAPEESMITTIDSFRYWMEQNGWLVIHKDKLLEKLVG